MTYSLNEPFDSPDGTWSHFAPWDATEAFDSVKGFLSTQKHVDLRSFRNWGLVDPRPQYPDLDVPPQTDLESPITQTELEFTCAVNDPMENWVLSQTGTGIDAATFTWGAIAGRGGWSGLQATTKTGAIDATITSSTSKPIDITPGQSLSIILPDYNSWDTNSYVQMSSDPAGAFGTGYDSAQVPFSANTASMPHLKLAISGFAQSGFDATHVTGIRIRFRKAAGAGAGHTLTVMAIRSLDSAWVESWLDFDTTIGCIVRPVTLNGNATTGTVAEAFEFVRGDGTKNDPVPADLKMNMIFYPGGATSPNDATGGTSNYLAFIMREQKNSGSGTGSHIEAGLTFNDTGTTFAANYVATTGGSPGTPTSLGVEFDLDIVLDAQKRYLFSVELKGTRIIPKLYQVKTDHTIVELVWEIDAVLSDPSYGYANGRVGFIGDLKNRDAYIEAIEVTPTGFAELQTVIYASRTPVDGAQLAAVFSEDMNLFRSMAGVDTVSDPNKTVSGDKSYRAAQSMTTNTFLVDDWTQMYLNLSIWVSDAVTQTNQPQILLNPPGLSSIALPMVKLKPSQWNSLSFDLGIFRELVTGAVPGPSFTIQPGDTPEKPLGFYWVDDVTIGRRRVAWSIRAIDTAPWRQFKNTVNNPNGGIHFTPEERGTALQLKAEALTEDAWISSFHLFPRYAQLGLPLFDRGGTNEVYPSDG